MNEEATASTRKGVVNARIDQEWKTHVLDLGRRLTPTSLEDAFHQFELRKNADKRGENLPLSLLADLSLIEWIELGAVAQLLLSTLHYATHGVSVQVKLPTPRMLSGEQDPRRAQDRASALRFLEYLQLPDRLSEIATGSQGQVSVLLGNQAWIKETAPHVIADSYRRVVPLRWIALDDEAERERVLKQLKSAASNAGIGIDAFDAEALASVVLYELIENVTLHSGRAQPALICAFAHRPFSGPVVDDFLQDERDYLKNLASNEQHLLEVIVGDAGEGIAKTLHQNYVEASSGVPGALTKNRQAVPNKVVEWALDRWSSSRNGEPQARGVRGLFRIDRIAKKYQGQLAIRTHRAHFVRDHTYFGTHIDRFKKEPNAHSYFHGTLIRARLVPAPAARLVLMPPQSASSPAPLPNSAEGVHFVHVDMLDDKGIPEAQRSQILEATSRQASLRPSLLVVFFTTTAQYNKVGIETAFHFLARHASPVPLLALNFPASHLEAQSSVQSVNDELARQKESTGGAASPSEARDLFCIASPAGQLLWAGVDPLIADELGVASVSQDGKEVAFEFFERLRTSSGMLTHFFDVVHVLESVPPRVKLSCKLNISLVANALKSQFLSYVNGSPRPTGVLRDATYLTPALQYVHTWLNIPEMFRVAQPSVSAQAAIGLAIKAAQTLGLNSNVAVLPTFGTTNAVRTMIVKALGLKEIATVRGEPVRSPLADSSTEVLIYIDIVSTGENVRRSIQAAKAQNLKVAGIACLIDARASALDTLTVLGDEIPLVSFCHLPTATEPSKSFHAISPTLRWIEQSDIPTQPPQAAEDPLLQAAGVLTFGHVRTQNGRHLTLTPDVPAFLKHPHFESFVSDAVHNFAARQRTSELHVWLPTDSRDPPERFAQTENLMLQAFRRAAQQPHAIVPQTRVMLFGSAIFHQDLARGAPFPHGSGLVIFDWGAVTGASLQALVNAGISLGAKSILVIIGANQLRQHERRFFASVSQVQGTALVPAENLFDTPTYVPVTASVEVRSFSTLHMGQYGQHDCPVCRQIGELRALRRSDPYLDGYIAYAAARLEKYSSSQVPSDGAKTNIYWIGWIRQMLREALISTLARRSVLDWLEEVTAESARPSEKVALLELLFLEDQWLRLAPLQFRECRKLIARMCTTLVRTSEGELQATAVAVLRKVSKTEFIARGFDLFKHLSSNRNAQQALLSGIHTYVAKDYHHGLALASDAASTVDKIFDYVKSSSDTPEQSVDCWGAIAFLKNQLDFLSSRAQLANKTPPALMNDLKRILRDDHNFNPHTQVSMAATRLTGSFVERVRVALEPPLTETKREEVQKRLPQTYRDLETCQQFLLAHVLPLMVYMQQEFSSASFRQICEPKEAAWLREFIASHESGLAPMQLKSSLDAVQRYVSSADDTDCQTARSSLKAYDSELRVLRNVLLLAESKRPTGNSAPSVVAKFIDTFPSSLEAAFRSAEQDSGINVKRPNFDLDTELVYCPTELLQRVVGEILENARKYSTDRAVTVSLDVTREHRLILTVKNRRPPNLRPSSGRHGLSQCAAELRSFYGVLRYALEDEHFRVTLELTSWRPH